MKVKTLTAILLTTLLYCSCNVEEPVEKPHDDASALHVGISCVQTKTWLDYQAGGSPLKVYWSDGDKINVNGISSLSLSVEDGTKTSLADFNIYGVETPFNVIYPASIVTEMVYDEEGYINVELPSSQAYHPTSFAEGTAIMCGYSETSDVTLSNLCAAVRVNVKGTDEVVSAVVASSSSAAPLCGKFRLNPQLAALAPVEGSAEVSLEFTETITLNAENGVDFFFTVPAADYSEGLSFYFKNVEGRNLECIWRPDAPLEAGKLYSFNNVEYVPGAKDITTAEEWNEFAAAMNAETEEEGAEVLQKYLYKGGFIRLGADIQAETLAAITKEFPYVFDGNGHSLTYSATSSLFDKVSGEIRDLTLNGNLDLTSEGAPFVRQLLPGASIKGCTNNMNVTFTLHNTAVYVAGFAAVLPTLKTEGEVVATTITDCTNNGSIIGSSSCEGLEAAYNVAIGGIAGDVRAGGSGNVPYSIVMENCKNTGKIMLTPIPPANHTTIGMGLTGIGGLVGTFRSSQSIVMNDCDNSGDITISAKEMKTDKGMKAYSICMGGVIGCSTSTSGVGLTLTGHDISITGCDNTGVLYNCGDNYSTTATGNNKVYTGGIAGALVGLETDYAVVNNCTSTGDIFPYDLVDGDQDVISARPAYCAVAGGLIGYGGYLDMSDCTVDCQIGKGRRPMAAWAGMVGFLVRPFRLKDSSVHLHGYFQRVTAFKMNRAVLAVVPCKSGSKEADVAGSQITGNLAISGCLYTSGSTLSSDDKSDLSASLTTKVFGDLDKAKAYLVAGEGFTANAGVDFTSANITYSAQ